MAKIEITMSDADKRKLEQAAADRQLRLATWARSVLLLAAMKREEP